MCKNHFTTRKNRQDPLLNRSEKICEGVVHVMAAFVWKLFNIFKEGGVGVLHEYYKINIFQADLRLEGVLVSKDSGEQLDAFLIKSIEGQP